MKEKRLLIAAGCRVEKIGRIWLSFAAVIAGRNGTEDSDFRIGSVMNTRAGVSGNRAG